MRAMVVSEWGDPEPMMLPELPVVGLHGGAYRMHDPGKIGEAMTAPFALYEQGKVQPVISSVRPLAAAAALQEIASRRRTGRGAARCVS